MYGKVAIIYQPCKLLVLLLNLSSLTLVAAVHTKFHHDRGEEKCHRNITHNQSPEQTVINSPPKCLTLNYPFCLGLKLPYRTMALPEYLPDLNISTIDDVQSYLTGWEGVKSVVPECWPHLRVALCSHLMPQCHEDSQTGRVNKISKPNVEICNDLKVKNRCKFIERHHGWPALFNCSDQSLYLRNCSNELRGYKYHDAKSISCRYPLVASNDSWFKEIRGCAISCKYPAFENEDQVHIGFVIGLFAPLGFLCSALALGLFNINKKTSKCSRMAKVIERCTIFQLFLYLGWSLQVLFDSDVACSPSGAKLEGLPLMANGCVLSFILTYLPDLSISFSIAYLGKLCHDKINGQNGKDSKESKLDFNFSLLSFVIPATFFVSIAFLGHIDGHGLYGICTVGQASLTIKIIFVLVPKVASTAFGNFFFIATILKLSRIERMRPALRRNVTRMQLLTTLSLMEVSLAIGIIAYETLNRSTWMDAIDDFLACDMNLRSVHEGDIEGESGPRQLCSLKARPFVSLYILEVVTIPLKGIVIASWAYSDSNLKGLRGKIIELVEDKSKRRRGKADMAESAMLTTHANRSKPASIGLAHDLIDMMSLRSDHGVELTAEQDHDPEPEPDSIPTSRATPSSLGSVSLRSNMYVNVNCPRPSRRSSRHKRGPSSRDIINDQRWRQQQASLLPPQTQTDLVANHLSQMMILQHINLLSSLPPREEMSLEECPFTLGMGDSCES